MGTGDLDKVLIDTSVWIDFFRKKQPYYKAVLELIDTDCIVCTGIIFGELLQGAKSTKEFNTLREFLYVFDFLPGKDKIWELAGTISFNLQRKGISVGLSDCFIAAVTKAHNVMLLTKDRHFGVIQQEIKHAVFKIKK